MLCQSKHSHGYKQGCNKERQKCEKLAVTGNQTQDTWVRNEPPVLWASLIAGLECGMERRNRKWNGTMNVQSCS